MIDTADIAYDMCERYVLAKEGVEYLDETQNMRGYRALSREYDRFFQEIVKANYTLVIISHADSKQIKEAGEKFDKTIPTIPARGFLVVSRLVDVTAYSSYETDENGVTHAMLTMRGSKFLEAGSRYKYMSEKIPFTYEALLADVNQAIDRMKAEDGAEISDKPNNLFVDNGEEVKFSDVMAELKVYSKALKDADLVDDCAKIVVEYLGKGRKISDCDESQLDMLVLILDDFKDLATEKGVAVGK